MVVQSQNAGSATQEADRAGVDDLWSRYFRDRTIEDRNRLVLFYAPLVKLVASRFASKLRSFQSVKELCSFGQFGLIDAVERFDPSGGFQFATYATTRIQGAIIDELRRDDILPKRMRARVRTYQVARETLEGDLRHTPTLSEVAEYLGTTLAETIELDDHAAMSSYLVPLSIAGDDPGGSMVGSGEAAIEPSEGAEQAAMRETVKAALLRIYQAPATGPGAALPGGIPEERDSRCARDRPLPGDAAPPPGTSEPPGRARRSARREATTRALD